MGEWKEKPPPSAALELGRKDMERSWRITGVSLQELEEDLSTRTPEVQPLDLKVTISHYRFISLTSFCRSLVTFGTAAKLVIMLTYAN